MQVFGNCSEPVRPLAHAVYDELRRVFPDAVITADADGIGFGTGPGYKYLVFTLLPDRKHVTIGFARGTDMPDPAGLLEGAGKVHRHVKIRAEEDLRRPELTELFTAALGRFRQPPSSAGQRGVSTQNSFPSGSAITCHGTESWPTSTLRAPSSSMRVTSAQWSSSR